MKKRARQRSLRLRKLFLLLLVSPLIVSCDRQFYQGSIAVERHIWELQVIDTIYFQGKPKASGTWYNKHNRLYYVEHYDQFPYPYSIGSVIYNFDRK